MPGKTPKNYFPVLTGVRSLAAVLVFITHFGYVLAANAPIYVQKYVSELVVGLPMFFFLTGFLIALRYYDKFDFSWDWTKKYLIARFARLYPVYFLFTFLTFVAYYLTRNEAIVAANKSPLYILFLNLTFLRGFFNDLKFTGVGQGWSLSIDVAFYFFTPFIFYLIKTKKVIFVQPLAICALGVLLTVIFGRFNYFGLFTDYTFTFYFTFFGRCFEIYMGILLALYYNRINIKLPPFLKLTYIGFAMMLGCVALFTLIPTSSAQAYQDYGVETPIGILINDFLLVPSVAVFFLGLIKEETLFKKILCTNFVQLLGNSAFVFYMIHLGFINNGLHQGINWLNDRIFEQYDKFGLDWHSPLENDQVNVVIIFVALYAISIAGYKFFEEPTNNWLRGLLSRKFDEQRKPVEISSAGIVANQVAKLAEPSVVES